MKGSRLEGFLPIAGPNPPVNRTRYGKARKPGRACSSMVPVRAYAPCLRGPVTFTLGVTPRRRALPEFSKGDKAMRRTILAAVPLSLLLACATPESQAERVIARFGPYCERLGYTKNTDPWRDCIMKEQARVTSIIWSKD